MCVGPLVLPRRFPDADDDLTGQKSAGQRSSSTSSILIRVRDLVQQLEQVQGANCKVCDSVE